MSEGSLSGWGGFWEMSFFRGFIKYVRPTELKPAPLFPALLPIWLTHIRSPGPSENKNTQWLPFSCKTHTNTVHTHTHTVHFAPPLDMMTKLIKSINQCCINFQVMSSVLLQNRRTAQHFVFPKVTFHTSKKKWEKDRRGLWRENDR